MLSARDETPSQVDAAHRAKLAYIYVRQSTAGQVRQHQESTTLQYRLVDRAAGLGWPRERIVVIDDDLGKSGTASAEQQGFQRLIAEIGLEGRVSAQPGCLAPGPQQSRLASVAGTVLDLRRGHRRWRAAV